MLLSVFVHPMGMRLMDIAPWFLHAEIFRDKAGNQLSIITMKLTQQTTND